MADTNREAPAQNGVQDQRTEGQEETREFDRAEGLTSDDGSPSELESLRAERDDARDRLLRQAAEFQNFRKRTAQERDTLVELGKVLVIERMLEVVDDLERSLGAVDEAESDRDTRAYQALKQGFELVYRKLVDELVRLDVEPIEAVGQPFDENLHDAMMQQPAPQGIAPGTVLTEIQKGYRLGDRILRHSKVVVANEASA